MNSPIAPCKNCPDRQIKCHSVCPKWAVYEREKTKLKAIIYAEKERRLDLINTKIRRKSG